MTNNIKIHIIDTSKHNRKKDNIGKLKKWIMFWQNPESEEVKKLAQDDKEIKESVEKLEEISSDENSSICEVEESGETEGIGKLEKWIMFLQDPESEEVKKIAQEDEIIREALEKLEELSKDEEVIRLVELREEYIKGYSNGIQEEKAEMTRKMKNEKMPIELIVKITGLSKEEIEQL